MDPTVQEKPRILHVDDFDEFLDEFGRLFSEHFDITSAQSGAEALETLARQCFDAIILDYDMPDMNGLDFVVEAKKRWPLIPCIFCTGQGSEEVARQAFTSGAADYFVKDFRFFVNQEKLVRSVRQALERRTMEEAFQREHHMLETIIEKNPYSLQIYDSNGHIARGNEASRELFHVTPPRWYNVFEDKVLLDAEFGPGFERVKKGEIVDVPVTHFNPRWSHPSLPDKESYTSGVMFPIMDAHGQMEHMVVMHQDVTARVEAERALEKARDDLQKTVDQLEVRVAERTAELEEANRSLQRQIDTGEKLQRELAQKNQELEAFAGRVSHDLRNDLLALRASLETEAPELHPKVARFLQRHDRLMEYVERLLSLSRAGRTISSRVEIPADPLVRQVFERIRRPDVEAEIRIQPDRSISGDPMGIEEIFSNLISNSFQYRDPSRDRLTIEVEIERIDARTRVIYRDNGIGIPPDNLDRIFNASFTTDRRHHYGLGLSFVLKIVEAHGGQITASSDGKGRGTQFEITLPEKAGRATRPPCPPGKTVPSSGL